MGLAKATMEIQKYTKAFDGCFSIKLVLNVRL